MSSSSTPSTAAVLARATELLSAVMSDEQIKAFVKTNKIRTFGKLAVMAEEAIIAARKPARSGKKAEARPTRWVAAADRKIKVLVDKNPKRLTAAERFELYYTKGITVSAYLAAGGQVRDLTWDTKMGFIAIEGE